MKTLKMAAIMMISAQIGGCASGQITDGSCKIFKPISNSTKDTTQTRREVIGHNKVFGAICKG